MKEELKSSSPLEKRSLRMSVFWDASGFVAIYS